MKHIEYLVRESYDGFEKLNFFGENLEEALTFIRSRIKEMKKASKHKKLIEYFSWRLEPMEMPF